MKTIIRLLQFTDLSVIEIFNFAPYFAYESHIVCHLGVTKVSHDFSNLFIVLNIYSQVSKLR